MQEKTLLWVHYLVLFYYSFFLPHLLFPFLINTQITKTFINDSTEFKISSTAQNKSTLHSNGLLSGKWWVLLPFPLSTCLLLQMQGSTILLVGKQEQWQRWLLETRRFKDHIWSHCSFYCLENLKIFTIIQKFLSIMSRPLKDLYIQK